MPNTFFWATFLFLLNPRQGIVDLEDLTLFLAPDENMSFAENIFRLNKHFRDLHKSIYLTILGSEDLDYISRAAFVKFSQKPSKYQGLCFEKLLPEGHVQPGDKISLKMSDIPDPEDELFDYRCIRALQLAHPRVELVDYKLLEVYFPAAHTYPVLRPQPSVPTEVDLSSCKTLTAYLVPSPDNPDSDPNTDQTPPKHGTSHREIIYSPPLMRQSTPKNDGQEPLRYIRSEPPFTTPFRDPPCDLSSPTPFFFVFPYATHFSLQHVETSNHRVHL